VEARDRNYSRLLRNKKSFESYLSEKIVCFGLNGCQSELGLNVVVQSP